ncbi:MAG: 50S ribosomal protein L21 [Candidatus Omnitrophica bacterium]|nr:50S ribosomal protein L21 [Candidatus Omnitrophota bacterium]MDD5430071.1 50S ribosomal protein L21 [Candidatus Omnitrophota bacterium]
MLAVVEIGKKQYLVNKGDTLKVQRLKEKEGKIAFDKVLILADDKKVKIGTPYIEKAKVEAEVLGEQKSKKVIVYKYNRRKKYRKKQGHRQIYTTLKITRVVASASSSSSK